MSKSIKLTDNNFIDSISIVHNKESLKNILNNKIIYETGSNDNGQYIKYTDGTMIQSGSIYTWVDIKTQDGALYRPADAIALPFPQNFVNTNYKVNVTASADIIGSYAINKYVGTVYVWCFAPSSRSAKGRYLDYIAIGYWK